MGSGTRVISYFLVCDSFLYGGSIKSRVRPSNRTEFARIGRFGDNSHPLPSRLRPSHSPTPATSTRSKPPLGVDGGRGAASSPPNPRATPSFRFFSEDMARGAIPDKWSMRILWGCAIGSAVGLYMVAVDRQMKNRDRMLAEALRAESEGSGETV